MESAEKVAPIEVYKLSGMQLQMRAGRTSQTAEEFVIALLALRKSLLFINSVVLIE